MASIFRSLQRRFKKYRTQQKSPKPTNREDKVASFPAHGPSPVSRLFKSIPILSRRRHSIPFTPARNLQGNQRSTTVTTALTHDEILELPPGTMYPRTIVRSDGSSPGSPNTNRSAAITLYRRQSERGNETFRADRALQLDLRTVQFNEYLIRLDQDYAFEQEELHGNLINCWKYITDQKREFDACNYEYGALGLSPLEHEHGTSGSVHHTPGTVNMTSAWSTSSSEE